MKLGVLDHAVLSKEQIQALADLPAKPVLQAQLLGVLMSPLQKLVTVLNEPGALLGSVAEGEIRKGGRRGRGERWLPIAQRLIGLAHP